MKKRGVKIIPVENQEKGLVLAKNLLYKEINKETLLFLSGGSTPKELYKALAQEKKLMPKAVGMIDERKDRSNYKMIKSTGLLNYLDNLKIKFYPILHRHLKGVRLNHEAFLKLVKKFKKKVAIMGIGEDGHTASLPASPKLQRGEPAGISNFQFPISNEYVIKINNFPGEFKERITLTFRALEKMDLLIVLAFGSAKQNVLDLMFKPGSLEEIPARFYTKPEIAKKTLLITDQKV